MTIISDLAPQDELVFLPLGGAGEIGMNLNLYGCKGRWLMVDLGVSFGDDTQPTIDVIMPDPTFIAERRDALAALVLTHAHEDHLGAVAHLWPRLRCPVYATPFAAAMLHGKLVEAGLQNQVSVTVVPLSARFQIGPFNIELITLTHSIPEPNALAIRTPYGTILHTGDWKFDPDPLVGAKSDTARLAEIGDEGVLALVGDSTNVFNPGTSGSEADVRVSLTKLFGQYDKRIAVACFATNVARLESIAVAAAANDRHVALVGRSLKKVDEAARANGYLKLLAPFISDTDAGFLPKDKVLYICTGSQGEPRAALARIAGNAHQQVVLEQGDVCIFSSRIIPGNERKIFDLQNRIAKLGVEIVTERDHFVHVSGHPARDELAEMYRLVRPRIAIPVHGEYRHLMAHAELAESCQVPLAIVNENGGMVRLGPGEPGIIDHVRSGRLALDGPRLVALESEILRERKKTMFSGSAVVTLVLDKAGKRLGEPQVSAQGVLSSEHEAEEHDAVVDAVRMAIDEMPAKARKDDFAVKEAARLAVRRALRDTHGKKPMTDVHLVRI
jgi:ribonuclease J